MSRRRALRPHLTAVSLVLAVVLAGCADDAEERQGTAGSDSSAGDTASSRPTERSRPSSPSSAPVTGPVLDVTVAGDEVSPTARTVTLDVGDVLTVDVTADRAGELHVHASPEQYVDFEQGRSRHTITLDKPGQVDIEEHDSGALVARLLVG